MTAPTMATGVLLVAAYWIEIQTSLACPVMVAVMLLRFRLCSAPHAAHQPRKA